MIRIEFHNDVGQLVTSTDSPTSHALIDVCDILRSPVEFSCRSGNCGTCRVEVLVGQHLLLPARADEQETLDAFDAPASHRLACRARLRTDAGLVRLRWAGDDP